MERRCIMYARRSDLLAATNVRPVCCWIHPISCVQLCPMGGAGCARIAELDGKHVEKPADEVLGQTQPVISGIPFQCPTHWDTGTSKHCRRES